MGTRLHGRFHSVAFLVTVPVQRSDLASDIVTTRFPTALYPGSKGAHASGSRVGFRAGHKQLGDQGGTAPKGRVFQPFWSQIGY